MKEKVTAKQLIDAVRLLAKKTPENVYRPKQISERNCHYNKGKCSDGSVGCIFGQTMRSLGPHPRGQLGIHNAMGLCGISTTDRERDWCMFVQNMQDRGSKWSDAIVRADEVYPLSD